MKFTRHIAIILSLVLLLFTVSLTLAATSTPEFTVASSALQITATVPPTSLPTPTVTLTTTASVTGTLTVTDTITSTATVSSTVILTTTSTAIPAHTAHPVAAPLPPGKNPETAIEPTGQWLFIEAGATHWYKVADNRLKLEIGVSTNGQEGLGLAVFAPEQTDLYGKPIGRGAYSKFFPAYDLFWSGRTVAYGTWFATVTNYKPFPISYSISYERKSTRPADECAKCHGYIIHWEDCQSADGFCDNLQDEYK
jgi:hypothetical protein